jgi:hypothetical protein
MTLNPGGAKTIVLWNEEFPNREFADLRMAARSQGAGMLRRPG